MSICRNLVIADFVIRFESEIPVYFDEGYLPFEADESARNPDLHVVCQPELPTGLITGRPLLFEALDDKAPLYRVLKHERGLLFCLYDQSRDRQIQQLLIMDERCTRATLFMLPQSDGQLDVMAYPLGPILMYYLTARNHAVLIHASGVFDGKSGRLFTGFSGTGKTTMAKLWKSEGSQIINDDRLIVRKKGDVFYMYNTPMFYPDRPKSAPLHSIHLIRHAPENSTERIIGAQAVSNVMAFCIQNNYDTSLIVNNVGVISELAAQVGVYKTGFVPDVRVTNFIKDNEC